MAVGLDLDILKNDYHNAAQLNFKDDLFVSEQLGVRSFPTFFFSNGDIHCKISGFQEYELFEEVILCLYPEAKRKTMNNCPNLLFKAFPTITDTEFSYLSNTSKEEGIKTLEAYLERGVLEKMTIKNGAIWKKKHEHSFQTPEAMEIMAKHVAAHNKSTLLEFIHSFEEMTIALGSSCIINPASSTKNQSEEKRFKEYDLTPNPKIQKVVNDQLLESILFGDKSENKRKI
jgi:hypothetical protein